MTNEKAYQPALMAVTTLFFLWALAHNLNPILLPHLKGSFQLSNFQTAIIDSSFYLAYFFMAIPAALVIGKFGYPNAMLIGLLLFATGAFLIYPAAAFHSFPIFLVGLFIIATGLTFLETSANPYVTALGKPERASYRLNLAQAFNGLGATLAAFAGGIIVLGANAGPEQVKIPYLTIGCLVVAIGIILYLIKLPNLESHSNIRLQQIPKILNNARVKKAVIAQFFYVGAQVGINGFFILYTSQTLGCTSEDAAKWLSLALFIFMTGRFVGSLLMKYYSPRKMLKIYALLNILLLIPVIVFPSTLSVMALVFTQLFMSVMFPTIFSLGIQGLEQETGLASSLLVMAVSGGAVITPCMGWLADQFGIAISFLAPLVCFVVILWFSQTIEHEKILTSA